MMIYNLSETVHNSKVPHEHKWEWDENGDLFKRIKTVCYVIQLDMYAYCKDGMEVMHL